MAIVVHRWVGLTLTAFLVVVGVTGSLLTFYHELDAALNPSLLRAGRPSPTAPLLDPLVLRRSVQDQLPPGLRASYLPLALEHEQAVTIWVDIPPAMEGSVDDEFFFDPYTGELLGSRLWGDLRQGRRNVLPFIYKLHYSLGIGDVGIFLLGLVALLWTVDCFVGAYLTFPPSARRDDARTPRSWLARWKPSWLIRTNGLFAFVFTWHRASGLWVWAMLFVFAWSGVALNLREVYRPVMRAAFGLEERAMKSLPRLTSSRDEPALSFAAAHARGRALMGEEAMASGFAVLREKSLRYAAELGAYEYRVVSSLDVSERYPSTNIWFDGDSGRRLAFDAPTGPTATGNTITTWLYQLHFGSVAGGGWPFRLFVSAMGWVVASLGVTGVWIWWRKRSKRRRGPSPA